MVSIDDAHGEEQQRIRESNKRAIDRELNDPALRISTLANRIAGATAIPRLIDDRKLTVNPDPINRPQPTSAESPHIDLRDWWMSKAAGEVEPMIAKMMEYGGDGRAIDLIEIGRTLQISGVKVPDDDASSAELSELGIYFYLVGKFARWTAAIAEGRPVSDDTLHDIGIYVRMVQRIRESGGWPE